MSVMPTIKLWVDDLRSVFGADEINQSLRTKGFYASEGGQVMNTIRPLGSFEISADRMVIARPVLDKKVGNV